MCLLGPDVLCRSWVGCLGYLLCSKHGMSSGSKEGPIILASPTHSQFPEVATITATSHVLFRPVLSFPSQVAERDAAWRRVVGLAVQQGVPTPGFSGSLSYFDTYRCVLHTCDLSMLVMYLVHTSALLALELMP